jgi:hypothetical protein
VSTDEIYFMKKFIVELLTVIYLSLVKGLIADILNSFFHNLGTSISESRIKENSSPDFVNFSIVKYKMTTSEIAGGTTWRTTYFIVL